MFGQTFDPHDLIIVGLLVVLEGVLSIDNALVLGLLARRLPKRLRPRALSYGLIGAFVFRVIAIFIAGFLLTWRLPKLIGGGYLVYMAIRHLFFDTGPAHEDGHGDRHHHEAAPRAATRQCDTADLGAVDMAEPEAVEPAPPGSLASRIDFAHASSTHTAAFWYTVAM